MNRIKIYEELNYTQGCLEAEVAKEILEILVEDLRDGEALGKGLPLQRLKMRFLAKEMVAAIVSIIKMRFRTHHADFFSERV